MALRPHSPTARLIPVRAALRVVVASTLAVTALIGLSTSALALSSSSTITSSQLDGATRHAHSSSVCAKVSAAAVSAIVGYPLPAATPFTLKLKASPANFGVATSGIDCTYGSQASMSTLLKDVTLSVETLSKPLTLAQMKLLLAKAGPTIKYTFTTYSGLGGPAFHMIFTESGITAQGITVGISGTTYFSALVYAKNMPTAKVAALVKLAEKL